MAKFAHYNDLPPELWLIIVVDLPFEELSALSLTCRYLRACFFSRLFSHIVMNTHFDVDVKKGLNQPMWAIPPSINQLAQEIHYKHQKEGFTACSSFTKMIEFQRLSNSLKQTLEMPNLHLIHCSYIELPAQAQLYLLRNKTVRTLAINLATLTPCRIPHKVGTGITSLILKGYVHGSWELLAALTPKLVDLDCHLLKRNYELLHFLLGHTFPRLRNFSVAWRGSPERPSNVSQELFDFISRTQTIENLHLYINSTSENEASHELVWNSLPPLCNLRTFYSNPHQVMSLQQSRTTLKALYFMDRFEVVWRDTMPDLLTKSIEEQTFPLIEELGFSANWHFGAVFPLMINNVIHLLPKLRRVRVWYDSFSHVHHPNRYFPMRDAVKYIFEGHWTEPLSQQIQCLIIGHKTGRLDAAWWENEQVERNIWDQLVTQAIAPNCPGLVEVRIESRKEPEDTLVKLSSYTGISDRTEEYLRYYLDEKEGWVSSK